MSEPRQLDLLKSKRHRGWAPPPPKERHVHIALADTLALFAGPEWKYSHLAQGEYRTPATAALLQRMGVKPGWPDFLFAGPGGICALEVKRQHERPTQAQREVGAAIVLGGGKWATADTYDVAVLILQQWGVLPAELTVASLRRRTP